MKSIRSDKLAEYAVFHGACQKISELSPLISKLRRRKLRAVVEIGTMKGGTFWLWCQLATPDAVLVSIDLPGGAFGGGYSIKDMRRFRGYRVGRQSLYFIRRDSHEEKTRNLLRKKLDGRSIDFLMIDGDHRYRGVKRDFQLYAPLVRQNGLIALHDILPHPKVPSCKVDRLWREIRGRYSHQEFKDRHDDRGWGQWGGIGLLRYRQSKE